MIVINNHHDCTRRFDQLNTTIEGARRQSALIVFDFQIAQFDREVFICKERKVSGAKGRGEEGERETFFEDFIVDDFHLNFFVRFHRIENQRSFGRFVIGAVRCRAVLGAVIDVDRVLQIAVRSCHVKSDVTGVLQDGVMLGFETNLTDLGLTVAQGLLILFLRQLVLVRLVQLLEQFLLYVSSASTKPFVRLDSIIR